MKRILSLVLVFTCIFSSFTLLASAEENTETSTETNTETNTETSTEHVHKPSKFLVYYTETTHEYRCTTCKENYIEDHTPDEEGNCPCGYFDHEHKPEAWYLSATPQYGGNNKHMFLCSECSNCAIVYEEHTYDEKGNCVCGWIDTNRAIVNNDIMSMLKSIYKILPQMINLLIKGYSKMFQIAF